MIRLISDPLEDMLRREEDNPVNRRAARTALENALIFQFQELADRLLSQAALFGRAGKEVWWQHYLTRTKPSEIPTSDSPSVIAFAKDFSTKIVAGRIRPLSIKDLDNIEIRVLNGFAKLWDERRINRQLCCLGSNLRLAYLGAHRLLVNQVRTFLGRQGSLPVDARFIFGRVAPLSSWPLGPIFNFEEEVAISPFLNAQGVGFNYENCVVVRQPLLKALVRDEKFLKLHALKILIHEMSHVTGFRAPFPRTYLEAYWTEDTTWDICRFTETPKSFEELDREFSLSFENPLLSDANRILGHERFPAPPYSLRGLLEKMTNDGAIHRLEEPELFKSNFFEEGKQWSV